MDIDEAGKSRVFESSASSTAKKLADEMGVPITDLMCLANSVANSLHQDKVTTEQVECMSGNDQIDLVRAYTCHAQRKIQQFHTAYLTNDKVKQTVRNTVYELLVLNRKR